MFLNICQYIPSLRSLFKESMIGFRKVVMVGFSLENHSPANIIFLLENLPNKKWGPNNLWLQTTVLGQLYLCSGGSSFTTSQTGQMEDFDERNRLTPSVFRVSDTLAGCITKEEYRWYSLPSLMSQMTSFRSGISCFCLCKHLQTVGSILKEQSRYENLIIPPPLLPLHSCMVAHNLLSESRLNVWMAQTRD